MLDLRRVDKWTLKGMEYRKSMPFYEISLRPMSSLHSILYFDGLSGENDYLWLD